jgi:uncharacterized protein (TIGR02452 family)
MNRASRVQIAKETLEILERGAYRSAAGRDVDIAEALRSCIAGTVLFSPEDLERLKAAVLARPAEGGEPETAIEVVNETTLEGVARLSQPRSSADGGTNEVRLLPKVAALNFASAKNPGGGFLNGSQAQEESLARSSGLHASLVREQAFYERHRASSSLLYTDAMILSPHCPVFRRDDGSLLDSPGAVAFITSPAPNAGAMTDTRGPELERVPDVLRARSEYVLALAASQGYERLVLGAWGCGVFGNDPKLVADCFMSHLRGPWRGRFERVVFSVLDRGEPPETFLAFENVRKPRE